MFLVVHVAALRGDVNLYYIDPAVKHRVGYIKYIYCITKLL